MSSIKNFTICIFVVAIGKHERQVETTCGYTPELLFGITMAESLIVASAVFVLLSIAMSVPAIARLR
jgi:hypothetical protein